MPCSQRLPEMKGQLWRHLLRGMGAGMLHEQRQLWVTLPQASRLRPRPAVLSRLLRVPKMEVWWWRRPLQGVEAIQHIYWWFVGPWVLLTRNLGVSPRALSHMCAYTASMHRSTVLDKGCRRLGRVATENHKWWGYACLNRTNEQSRKTNVRFSWLLFLPGKVDLMILVLGYGK